MSQCTIDAEYKGEERYSKLSIAYSTLEDKKRIDNAISEITPNYDIEPQLYSSELSNGRSVLVIEYHDDYDRLAGDIFETLLAKLEIRCS